VSRRRYTTGIRGEEEVTPKPFLGRPSRRATTPHLFDLTDGQQRLTTITMLLHALVEHLPASPDLDAVRRRRAAVDVTKAVQGNRPAKKSRK
jgi:hypothetical protein